MGKIVNPLSADDCEHQRPARPPNTNRHSMASGASRASAASKRSSMAFATGLFFNEAAVATPSTPPEEKTKLVPHKTAAGEEEETEDELYEEVEFSGAGLTTSIFNVCNVCLGAGTLSMPLAFMQVGVVLGLALLTLIYCLMSFTAVMLCEAALEVTDDLSTVTYGGIVRKVFGARGTVAVQWVTVVATAGVATAYLQLAGDLLSAPLAYWSGPSPDTYCSTFTSRGFLMACALGIECILCLLPSLKALRYVSLAAVVSMLYLTVVIIYDSIDRVVDGESDDHRGSVSYASLGTDMFRSLSLLTFAFGPHIQVVQMLGEFEDPSPKRIRVWVWSSLTLCYLIYVLVGVFGYLAFRDDTNGNILLNHSGSDTKITVGRLGVAFSVIGGYPTYCAPCVQALDRFFFPDKEPSVWGRRLLWIALFLAVTFGIAFVVEDVSVVLGLTGAGAQTVACFLLPPSLYLVIKKEEHGWAGTTLQRIAWTAIAVGIVCGSIAVVVNLIEAINPDPSDECIWPVNCKGVDFGCCPDNPVTPGGYTGESETCVV